LQKKWIVTSVVVLAAAGLMPWIVGYVTEQQWHAVTEEVNRSQPFIQMSNDQYQRGFLGSDLHGSLVLLNPETGESQRIAYRASVTHGVVGSLMDFQPENGWSPDNTEWFPDELPKLTLESRLWGSITLEFSAPAMDLTNTDSGKSLASSGGVARLTMNNVGSSAEARLEWPLLSITGPDMNVEISDFYVEQQMEYLRGRIWTGSGEMRVASTRIEPMGQPAITLQGLSMTGSSEVSPDGERVSSNGEVLLEKVRLQHKSYGPQKLQMALNELNVDSWSKLSESVSELQTLAVQQKADGKNRFEQQMAAMTDVNAALRDLAAEGFSVGIPELILTTPEGEVSGSIMITHPELTNDQKSGMLLIMQQLTGEMNLRLPVALAENYPAVRMQVAPLIKQGLLIQDGDELAMKASLKDLTMNVNGTEIPLPPLF
jgi:uncharacterized protein YdgA (DUF945 family)